MPVADRDVPVSTPAPADPFSTPFDPIAQEIERRLARLGIRLTLGGEPTLVPNEPQGAEWNFLAVGPTKLRYAYTLAAEIIRRFLPGAITVFSPGKQYPGEINPRWVVNVLAHRDGTPLAAIDGDKSKNRRKAPKTHTWRALLRAIAEGLGLPPDSWVTAVDPQDTKRPSAVLPLDHQEDHWITSSWRLPGGRKRLRLLDAEGPAGLRLPLNELPPDALRRALTMDAHADGLHVFLPPLLQPPFRELLALVATEIAEHQLGPVRFEGYLPPDEENCWIRLGLTADPGVLEINVPPCETWRDYHRWLTILEETGRVAGLRSWKVDAAGEPTGTGGGNHLLFGGPSLEENAFFSRPAWVASLLRYFQAHPCLAYLFTGMYVGPSSQAPRPDESARDLYDLGLAYEYLAALPVGEDHRYLIGETLRHMHTDITGNTHRSEISFDKFWYVGGPPGSTSGLIEFRAVESLPHAGWMSLIALLWEAVALYTLEKPSAGLLIDHRSRLHDYFFLPTPLWLDLQSILTDLRAAGLALTEESFRDIWQWRFPTRLAVDLGKGATLTVRRACEGWPLLSETPSEGGTTSRFVDTSIERLEFSGSDAFARKHRILVNGRALELLSIKAPAAPARTKSAHTHLCGLRYRRTALYPSLHPGIKPHLPLELAIFGLAADKPHSVYRLEENSREFRPVPVSKLRHAISATPVLRPDPQLMTYDLRLV